MQKIEFLSGGPWMASFFLSFFFAFRVFIRICVAHPNRLFGRRGSDRPPFSRKAMNLFIY